MIRAVLFDIGQTLVGDPRPSAWADLRRHGFNGTLVAIDRGALVDALEIADAEADAPAYSHFLGEPEIARRALALAGSDATPALVDDLVQAFRQAATRLLASDDTLVPLRSAELAGILEETRAAGVKAFGIVSNERSWAPVIYLRDVLGIDPALFDAVVTSDGCGIGKPDPRIFKIALDALEVPAADAIYVGDSVVHDIEPAVAIGMRAVLMTGLTSGMPAAAPPGVPVIASLRKLPSVVSWLNRL